jgi:hypothetical protein
VANTAAAVSVRRRFMVAPGSCGRPRTAEWPFGCGSVTPVTGNLTRLVFANTSFRHGFPSALL